MGHRRTASHDQQDRLSSQRSTRRSAWSTGVAAAVLFAAILGFRATYAHNADASLVLFVVPIALCAIEFGARGGLAAALFGFLLLVGWDVVSTDNLGSVGIATRSTAYLIVGGLLGRFVDERRALEAKVERHYDLSLDLFGTANLEGYFEELNPAWEQTLGHSTAELCSKPFLEFVHPEDRERTEAEAAKLAEGEVTVHFRNRYRTADGDYLWLEWNVHPVPEEQRLYATARDITVQKEAEQALQNQSDLLEKMVRERTKALEESQLETLKRLAAAAEYRDDDTARHTERVGATAALVAKQLGLADDYVRVLRRAAPLHDVGKIGVSDQILLKPGKLTCEEFETMKQHTVIGANLLSGSGSKTLKLGEEIALTHHERWDGGGYPNLLVGQDIPIGARIVAVADSFDAMTHDRPYKQAMGIDEALAEIERCSGTQFDPSIVDAFLSLPRDQLGALVDKPHHGNQTRPRRLKDRSVSTT